MELGQQSINLFRSAMRKKISNMFIVTGNTNPFKINLPNDIKLDPTIDYEVALIRFESYNSIFNINSTTPVYESWDVLNFLVSFLKDCPGKIFPAKSYENLEEFLFKISQINKLANTCKNLIRKCMIICKHYPVKSCKKLKLKILRILA